MKTNNIIRDCSDKTVKENTLYIIAEPWKPNINTIFYFERESHVKWKITELYSGITIIHTSKSPKVLNIKILEFD